MTDHLTAQELRDDYLERLEAASGDLPHRLAMELRAGIAEELQGGDRETVATRISELGSPFEVAQAARDAGFGATVPGPSLPSAQPVQVSKPALAETRGYAIAAALVLGFGGILVPVIGWCVGVVLVTTSKMWTRGEKLWGILFPVVALVAISIALGVVGAMTESASVAHASAFYPPSVSDFGQAFGFSTIRSLLIGGWTLAPFSALWLILRLRGRRPASD